MAAGRIDPAPTIASDSSWSSESSLVPWRARPAGRGAGVTPPRWSRQERQMEPCFFLRVGYDDNAAGARVGTRAAHDRQRLLGALVIGDAFDDDVTPAQHERSRHLPAEGLVEVAALGGDEVRLKAALGGAVRPAKAAGEDRHVPGRLLAQRRVVDELQGRVALPDDEIERAGGRPSLPGAARGHYGDYGDERRACDAEADGETRHILPSSVRAPSGAEPRTHSHHHPERDATRHRSTVASRTPRVAETALGGTNAKRPTLTPLPWAPGPRPARHRALKIPLAPKLCATATARSDTKSLRSLGAAAARGRGD